MNSILKKIFEPKKNIIFFLLFVFTIILFFSCLDYTYKKMKALIILFYFLPGVIFFVFGSIYNIKMYKNVEIKKKIIILFPLLIIVLYLIYILCMLFYAMIYR